MYLQLFQWAHQINVSCLNISYPGNATPIITYAPFAIIGYIGTLNMLDLLGYGLQPLLRVGGILKQALENLDSGVC